MPINFTDDDKVKGNWFKFENVGDKIQGTFVGKRQVMNQLSGQNQWIYEIMTEEGEYWNIGGKPAIDTQMRRIPFGQIVEFRYIEERPSKKAGMNAAKIIGVYTSKDAVNKEWLQGQEQSNMAAAEGGEEVDVEEVAKQFGGKVVDETPEDDKVKQIKELAVQKLGVAANATDEQLKATVQEKTGLAYIDTNLDNILEKLRTM